VDRQGDFSLQTWIFQGNPEYFDIDGYFATNPGRFVWLVTRYADEMRSGDRVFIYRTGPTAGVVAEAEIIGAPAPQPEDPEAVRFWRGDRTGAMEVRPRVPLSLLRVAGNREVLRRDWLREDPVLQDLPNLKMAAGTNYPIESGHAARLMALWDRTGRDWTRNESVAGLWAYAQTYGQQVSRLPGSPVAEISLALGRAVSGVYNKVMNFRAIDPRDQRAGMSGGGETDRRVWAEFYDEEAGDLRRAELEREFNRLWRAAGESASSPSDADQDAAVLTQAKRLVAEGLGALMAKYARLREARPARPSTKSVSIRSYERSALVVAIAKLRADNRCEIPNCKHPVFVDVDGIPFTEVHHIEPLSEGGEDVLENVACLCPAHHREVHVGRRAPDLTAALRAVRNAILVQPDAELAG
jgi:predicted HNH restriction endonuclease